MSANRLQPGDVIDEELLRWKPGYFKNARDLADAAMLRVGINPPYHDASLEALAGDLIDNDDRKQGDK